MLASSPGSDRTDGSRFLLRYVALVASLGLGAVLFLGLDPATWRTGFDSGVFWVLCGFVLAGELFPITVPRGDDVEEITPSTAFAFALVLGFGTGPAVVVLALVSVIADLAFGKPPHKILFNAGQYALSYGAGGAVYELLGGMPGLHVPTAGPALVAGLTFFLVNNILTGVAVAISQDMPVIPYLVRDLAFQAVTAAVLLAMAPIVLVAAGTSLWLVPLLVAPVAATYWAATESLENAHLIGKLEGNLARMTELNRMKDDFVAVVSHELRTPLTSIQGYVKTLLQLDQTLGHDQRRSFLEAADRQGERLRRLIEQLLIVGRLESHVEPLSLTTVSLDVLTRHVVEELRPRAHGHTFDLRFDPNMGTVETDESKVHQILSNLVENALKYSPPDTRVTIEGEPAGDGARIAVHDEGPGIAQASQERVFERFYQADQSITRRVGGTGLGLYICAKMAEAIGGRVWLERSDARGSVFCLWVPDRPNGGGDVVQVDEPSSALALKP